MIILKGLQEVVGVFADVSQRPNGQVGSVRMIDIGLADAECAGGLVGVVFNIEAVAGGHFIHRRLVL